MRVVLFAIILLTLVQGGSADAAAVSVMHQIYAALFYMMALIAFCTLALMGPVKGFCCNWDWRGDKEGKDKPHGPKHHHGHRPGERPVPEEYEELEELTEEGLDDDYENLERPQPLRPRQTAQETSGKPRIRVRK